MQIRRAPSTDARGERSTATIDLQTLERLEQRVQLSQGAPDVLAEPLISGEAVGAAPLTHTTSALSSARWLLAGAGVGGKALFAGGITHTLQDSDVAEIYDSTTGR